MAFEPGKSPYNALIIGAVAVVLALVIFLMFRAGPDQQAELQDPPTITAPEGAPPAPPADPPDATPPATPPAEESPGAQ